MDYTNSDNKRINAVTSGDDFLVEIQNVSNAISDLNIIINLYERNKIE